MANKKRGRPPKSEDEKLRGYRYNLNLDRDLNDYLHEAAWLNKTSITQYINDLIRADMEINAEQKVSNSMNRLENLTCEWDLLKCLCKICEVNNTNIESATLFKISKVIIEVLKGNQKSMR